MVCSLAVCSHSAARCSAFVRATCSDASATTRDVQLAFLFCSCSCSCLQLCASALAASAAAAAAFSACHAHALHQWDNSGNTMPLCMRLDISHCSDCMHAASRHCDSVPTLQHWPGDTLVSSYEECPLHKGQVKVREVLNTIGRRRGSLYH